MRQLTAIMFTDLVGFTALMQEDEAEARMAVLRHRRLLERWVVEHGGETVQFYGDGTLSLFPSAIGAVQAAIAIQREAAVEPALPLRIGIHTGDVVRGDDGVYGDGVNIAARIQGLAIPGSVLLSGKVHDEVKNHRTLQTRPLGAFDLKNVKQPIEVVAVLGEHLRVPLPQDLPTVGRAREQSVAVLPFVSMSSDPENEFFSDGMTEEIINVLTRIDGLKVTARTSSFAFKGRNEDIREIGRQLGVATLLEGSVRRAGPRVRVTAQLIDTRNGYHLFSEVYDRPLEDIFQVQDDIAGAIAGQLQVHLGVISRVTGEHRAFPSESCNCEAYTEYLRGLHHLNRWTPEDAHKAIAAFEASLAVDGEWPQPLASTAAALIFLGAIGHQRAVEVYPRAEAAARRALALDPDLGDAHTMLGLAHLLYHWDVAQAYASFQRALTLNPGSAHVHHMYAFYLRAVGAYAESVTELEAALALDPLALPIMTELGTAYSKAGRPDDAVRVLRAALDLDPTFRAAWEALGMTHFDRGDIEEASRHLEQLPRITGNPATGAGLRAVAHARAGRVDEARRLLGLLEARERAEPEVNLHIDIAAVLATLGDLDAALDRLEAAAACRSAALIYLATTAIWDPLRGLPRFEALERLAHGAPAGTS